MRCTHRQQCSLRCATTKHSLKSKPCNPPPPPQHTKEDPEPIIPDIFSQSPPFVGDKSGESLGGESGFPELLGSPRTSPEVPQTSPEVFRLLPRKFSHCGNLTAIQGFPGSFPDFPGSSPDFPGSFPDFSGGQPLSLGSLTDAQKLSLIRRADTQTLTRSASFFSTHSDTQAVPAFHCIGMFKSIFSTRWRFSKTHRHAVYHCLKKVQKPISTR